MSRAELSLQLGQTKYFENGTQIKVKGGEKRRKVKKGVSRHEAIHAVIAVVRGRIVRRVTRVPGHGYKGLTELDAYDGAAFMGPEVAQEDGTGHDVFHAELCNDRYRGAAIAKTIIDTHTEEIDAVTEGIEEQETLTHNGVVSFMEKGARRRLGIIATVVSFIMPDGKIQERKTESFGGKVTIFHDLIPGEWADLGTELSKAE